jgi:outer membrane protein assembly factor BamB
MGHGNQKGAAIIAGLTTRCSSAFALIASCWVVVCAQSPVPRPHPLPASPKADRSPVSLFPTVPVWTLALGSQLIVPPAYSGAHVFFSLEADRIAAYDILSGQRTWLAAARPQAQPIAGDGLLFIVEPDALTALNAADGLAAWQLPFGEKLSVAPVWDNGWLVVSTASGEILAFRAADGHLVWRKRLESPAHAPPALAGDRVYVPAENGRIIALQIETGEPLWERRLGGAANDILALNERIYAGSADNYFYCVMAKDGRVAWRWRTGGDTIGTPAADDDRVYFVSLDNILRALDLKSGVQQWMRPLPLRPGWGPVRAGATITVAGLAASVRAFDMKDGKPAGELPAGGEVAAPPHALEHPLTKAPMLLMVTRDIAKGAAASLVMRSFEPPSTPVSPLPNLIEIAPTAPAPATPR